MPGSLILDTTEFLGALNRLKPVAPRRRKTSRIAKAIKQDDLYIAVLDDEAIFSSHGVQTKCVIEKASWRGYVSTDFGMVLTFLKVKPAGKTVTISFIGDKLKIESLTIACKWAPVPDWIGSMSAEALFLSEKAKPMEEPLYCPKCGKRQIVALSHKPHMQLELESPPLPKTLPNRQCKSCKYGWVEIEDIEE